MKTHQITTYSFEELSKEAQEQAINELRDINTDYDWWDTVYDEWTEKLQKLGFYDIKIYFSGFWSQGDGACFDAKVDVAKWLKAHKLAKQYRTLYNRADEGLFEISQQGHYYHEHSMTIDNQYYETYGVAGRQVEAVYELVEKEIVELAKGIYKDLETAYTYLQSNESIIETIKANEYDFLDSGKVY